MRERLKQPISVASIRRIIREQFGDDAKAARVTTIHGGLFNTSYKIRLGDGRTVVLRIAPPRDKPLLVCEAGLLEREIHFMRGLGEASPADAEVAVRGSVETGDRPELHHLGVL